MKMKAIGARMCKLSRALDSEASLEAINGEDLQRAHQRIERLQQFSEGMYTAYNIRHDTDLSRSHDGASTVRGHIRPCVWALAAHIRGLMQSQSAWADQTRTERAKSIASRLACNRRQVFGKTIKQ